MRASSAAGSASTYSREPCGPPSSAPQKAKRTVRSGAGSSARRSATTSRVATPEPLSLMPGPASTESRCAPSMMTSAGHRPAPRGGSRSRHRRRRRSGEPPRSRPSASRLGDVRRPMRRSRPCRSRGCLRSHRRSAGAPQGAHECPRSRRRRAGLSQARRGKLGRCLARRAGGDRRRTCVPIPTAAWFGRRSRSRAPLHNRRVPTAAIRHGRSRAATGGEYSHRCRSYRAATNSRKPMSPGEWPARVRSTAASLNCWMPWLTRCIT